MKRKLKKTIASFMAVASLTAFPIGLSANASTANQYFEFDVSVMSWTAATVPVPKDTRSSVYFTMNSADNSVKVKTYGCTRSGNSYSWASNLTLSRTGSSTSYVTCGVGTEYEIYNSIKETGYGYAGIKMQTKGFSDNHAKGAWSADFETEYGHTYTVAN